MITYVDLYFPASPVDASAIAERLRTQVGLSFIRGHHDLFFRWEKFEEFERWIDRIHTALAGTGVIYRFISKEEEQETARDFVGWPPVRLAQHWPGEEGGKPPHPPSAIGTPR